jgi:hypothetical protein
MPAPVRYRSTAAVYDDGGAAEVNAYLAPAAGLVRRRSR